jgi:Ser/Thr protein kinase RdoA (MazF antagonist)
MENPNSRFPGEHYAFPSAAEVSIALPPETPLLRPLAERNLTVAALHSTADGQLLRALELLQTRRAATTTRAVGTPSS